MESNAPISTGTAQHLVDANNVEGMYTDAKMERVLARCLSHVFVGTNTGGFESLGRHLLVLIRDKVSAEGEVVNTGTFATQVEDADLYGGNRHE